SRMTVSAACSPAPVPPAPSATMITTPPSSSTTFSRSSQRRRYATVMEVVSKFSMGVLALGRNQDGRTVYSLSAVIGRASRSFHYSKADVRLLPHPALRKSTLRVGSRAAPGEALGGLDGVVGPPPVLPIHADTPPLHPRLPAIREHGERG